MLVLVTYDVNTETTSGKKRLRKMAKLCTNYGQRVQKSVFECILNPSQYVLLKAQVEEIMDKERDNVRFYNLGERYKTKIDQLGIYNEFKQDDILII